MRTLATALVALLLGCGEPTRVRIVGERGPEDVTLPTLVDLDTVSGEVGDILGGARIRLEPAEDVLDRAQNRELLVAHPRPVRANYLVDGDRVAIATDFDTLVMFSTYTHLERAALGFDALGVAIAATPVPVYYAPTVVGGSLPSTDAVAYVLGADFFIVESSGELPGLPLGSNPGVIVHEYSHRVWYYELWRGTLLEHLPTILDDEAQTASYNLLRAADEGVADYFGATTVDDPRYIGRSFDGIANRELDRSFTVDPAWLDGRAPIVVGRYDPYALGMVLASTLWRLRSDTLDAALIDTQRVLAAELTLPLEYTLGDFEIALLALLDATARVDACSEFEESYAVVWDRFASVCP